MRVVRSDAPVSIGTDCVCPALNQAPLAVKRALAEACIIMQLYCRDEWALGLTLRSERCAVEKEPAVLANKNPTLSIDTSSTKLIMSHLELAEADALRLAKAPPTNAAL